LNDAPIALSPDSQYAGARTVVFMREPALEIIVKTRSLVAALLLTASLCVSGIPASAQVGTVPPADVLVVGGTPAGVAAAIAAARRGERVDLVDARPELGGVLTDAMMDQWDLNLADDGTTIEGGLFSEIHARLGDVFSPAQAASMFLDLVMAEPRISLFLNNRAIAVEDAPGTAPRTVAEIAFRNTRTGKTFALSAPQIVDATDNADIAALAGAHYDLGRQDTGQDEKMQAVTLMFTVNGVDWPQVVTSYDTRADGPGGAVDRRAWGYSRTMRAYRPLSPDVLVRDLNLGHEDDGAVTVNAIDVLGIDGLVPDDLARARALTEAEAPHLVDWLRTHVAGFATASVGRYASAIYVRETRHVAGLERLDADDVWDGTIPADSIGLSSYPLDLHPLTADEKPAFAPVRHVYGVPFGTLVPRDLTNVVLASPAISATHIASGSARVIPTTIEEGEAAGDAAALANQRHLTFAQIDRTPAALTALRIELSGEGAILALVRVKNA